MPWTGNGGTVKLRDMLRKPSVALTPIGKGEVTLKGHKAAYLLKRSPRAKNVRLEIRPVSGLTVIIPRQYDPKRLPALLQQKADWILSRLAKCLQVRAAPDIENGDSIPFLGRDLTLRVSPTIDDFTTIRLDGDDLLVKLAPSHDLNLLLPRWYHREAAGVIERLADSFSKSIGVSYQRLTIRGQRSRWGSCSAKRNLNFNWKLMMAPAAVLDYVIIHELCHLKEMNHRKAFWALVAQFSPKWREHKKWLKDHQAELSARFGGEE